LDGDEGDGYDEGEYVDCPNVAKISSQTFEVIYPVSLSCIDNELPATKPIFLDGL